MSKVDNQERQETRQTLYFLRHAVSRHNLPLKSVLSEDGKTYIHHHVNHKDPMYTDSKLALPKAHRQATKAGKRLKKAICSNNNDGEIRNTLDYVLVSPLSRCLETAYFVMDELERDIMPTERNRERQKHRAPWICKEDLREAHGISYSGKRSCRSVLEQDWPHVQFDPNMAEDDEAWNPNERESFKDLNNRIDNFLVWVSWNGLLEHNKSILNEKTDEKQHLLVVSHSLWIECLFERYKPEVFNGGRSIHNCDLYSAELVCSWKRDIATEHNHNKWKCKSISFENVKFWNE